MVLVIKHNCTTLSVATSQFVGHRVACRHKRILLHCMTMYALITQWLTYQNRNKRRHAAVCLPQHATIRYDRIAD